MSDTIESECVHQPIGTCDRCEADEVYRLRELAREQARIIGRLKEVNARRLRSNRLDMGRLREALDALGPRDEALRRIAAMDHDPDCVIARIKTGRCVCHVAVAKEALGE